MRETRSSGSVEGVVSNHDPYSDFFRSSFLAFLCRYLSLSLHQVGVARRVSGRAEVAVSRPLPIT
jgi:hypothetical protein